MVNLSQNVKSVIVAGALALGIGGCMYLSKYHNIDPKQAVKKSKNKNWADTYRLIGTNLPKREYIDVAWDYPPHGSNIMFNIKFTTNYALKTQYWWTMITVTGTTCRLYITNYPTGFFSVTATDIATGLESGFSRTTNQ